MDFLLLYREVIPRLSFLMAHYFGRISHEDQIQTMSDLLTRFHYANTLTLLSEAEINALHRLSDLINCNVVYQT